MLIHTLIGCLNHTNKKEDWIREFQSLMDAKFIEN